MVYPEVENRRKLLESLYAKLSASAEAPLMIWGADLSSAGRDLGLSETETFRLFRRLASNGFVRLAQQGDPYIISINGEFIGVLVDDLTDAGLRAINLLPPENSIEGVLAVLEDYLQQVSQDPQLSPEEKARRRTTLQRMRDVLRDTATAVGPKILVELMTRGLGM